MSAKSQINIVKIKVTKYPSLANLVKQILCVPTTSASVEQVLSHGGIVVRPHRSSLADKDFIKFYFSNATNLHLMRQNCFKLVSARKFLFLFCINNYSQKTLIDHGFMDAKNCSKYS